jgi:hypothetical protein
LYFGGTYDTNVKFYKGELDGAVRDVFFGKAGSQTAKGCTGECAGHNVAGAVEGGATIQGGEDGLILKSVRHSDSKHVPEFVLLII